MHSEILTHLEEENYFLGKLPLTNCMNLSKEFSFFSPASLIDFVQDESQMTDKLRFHAAVPAVW